MTDKYPTGARVEIRTGTDIRGKQGTIQRKQGPLYAVRIDGVGIRLLPAASLRKVVQA